MPLWDTKKWHCSFVHVTSYMYIKYEIVCKFRRSPCCLQTILWHRWTMTNLPSKTVVKEVEEDGKRYLVTTIEKQVWQEECWFPGIRCVTTKGLLECRMYWQIEFSKKIVNARWVIKNTVWRNSLLIRKQFNHAHTIGKPQKKICWTIFVYGRQQSAKAS